jgi:hypothetical protein
MPEERISDICSFSTFFMRQDWILGISFVDEYNGKLHELINEMICEHNWRLHEILSLPIGLRSFHRDCINNRVQRKNDQMNQK